MITVTKDGKTRQVPGYLRDQLVADQIILIMLKELGLALGGTKLR